MPQQDQEHPTPYVYPFADEWEVVQYIIEFYDTVGFPTIFELVHLFRVDENWQKALQTSNGARAWKEAAKRTLGVTPPFIEDPATALDVEAAAVTYAMIFEGGYCECGQWLADLPCSFTSGLPQWSCSTSGLLCDSDPSSDMDENEFLKWTEWRDDARQAIADPIFAMERRLRISLQYWLQECPWTWDEVCMSLPMIEAAVKVRSTGTPLSLQDQTELKRTIISTLVWDEDIDQDLDDGAFAGNSSTEQVSPEDSFTSIPSMSFVPILEHENIRVADDPINKSVSNLLAMLSASSDELPLTARAINVRDKDAPSKDKDAV